VKPFSLLLLFLLSARSLAGGQPIDVAATTTMLADLVRNVGGDRIHLYQLMGPGVDPHLYKATPTDSIRLQKAKIIFANGLHLEGRLGEMIDNLSAKGKIVVSVAEKLPKEDLIPTGDVTFDPHIWGDAQLWAKALDVVTATLAEQDPDGREEYTANADAYRAKLTSLDGWAKARVAEIPETRRILITSHDAFNYLGRAYGFQVEGVQGLSTASEAGLADLARVVDLIKESNLPAIFVESSVPHDTIERISKDSGAKVGGELYSDATGTPGELVTVGGETYDVGTYFGMMKHNINTAVEGLR
jgi:manganese/zinc/iron transport system substrate-binding protein